MLDYHRTLYISIIDYCFDFMYVLFLLLLLLLLFLLLVVVVVVVKIWIHGWNRHKNPPLLWFQDL